ncbi:hypothetical protein [uncultured Deinococcus sp.]|uniref:hypothetical protein n=1 Tax=uncultured Deinococcus sp. TaxID=158789 RepID=UPI00258AAED1|nr:hypothetical protein [uncultured Deinococcus sp.]
MDLAQRLALDFKSSDLGDTTDQFTARLGYVVQQAEARGTASEAQQEAGARYVLLGAQLRQLTRKAERLKAASGAEVQQDLATLIAEVRAQMKEQLTASGLGPAPKPRRGSTSTEMEVTY